MSTTEEALLNFVPGGQFIGAGLGLLGGLANNAEAQQTRDDIRGFTEFQDQTFDTGFGSGRVDAQGNNQFQLTPQQQAQQNMIAGQSQGLLGGGLFNQQNFQNAFQGNDIAGALAQANQGFSAQSGNTAFGGLGGLFNQQAGLGQQFAQQTAAGPQDFSGGLQANLFGQGFANQQAAGDQSALFNQSLTNQRNAAESQTNKNFNRLFDKQFAMGQLGSAGGAGQTEGFFNALNQQDLGFQNNAQNQATQQQNFLANLGSAQIGQGQGFLGQNLGQFNQGAQFAQQFGQNAAGIEGQQFGQNLQGLGFNASQGQNRLAAAQGLFGQGADVFGQQFGLGLQGQDALLQQGRFGLDSLLGFRGAEADRINATGQGSAALASVQDSSGGLLGGVLGGLGSLF